MCVKVFISAVVYVTVCVRSVRKLETATAIFRHSVTKELNFGVSVYLWHIVCTRDNQPETRQAQLIGLNSHDRRESNSAPRITQQRRRRR